MKRALIGLLAVCSILVGVYFLGLVTRGLLGRTAHLRTPRELGVFTLALMLELMLVWMGVRGLRLATGSVSLTEPRVKLWRIVLGVLLLYSAARDTVDPGSRYFQADNYGQQVGMWIAKVFSVLFSLWLIVSAVRSKFAAPKPKVTG